MGCAAAAVVGQKPVVVSEPEIPPKPQRAQGLLGQQLLARSFLSRGARAGARLSFVTYAA